MALSVILLIFRTLLTTMETRTYSPASALRTPLHLVHDMFTDLWAGRGLAWRLFFRDLSAMYRQTMLGYVWAFLPPIASTLVFVMLNANGVLNVDVPMPYPVYAFIGMLLWQVFVDAIQSPIKTVSAAKVMLAKINLPREAVLLSGLYMVFFNFFIRLILLLALFLYYQIVPPWQAVFLPLGIFALVGLGFMIGLIFTPAAVLYQDVSQALPMLLPLLLFLTPVIYEARDDGILGFLSTYNPISPLIMVSRDWLTTGETQHLVPFLIVTGGTFVLAFLGWMVFRLAMPHLIARMPN